MLLKENTKSELLHEITFDQNISFQVIKKVKHLYPEAVSVREVHLENATDIELLNFAKKSAYSIVTFDADFAEINILKDQPPKIIWLRIGNTSTDNLAKVFQDYYESIKEFIENEIYKDIGCLEID